MVHTNMDPLVAPIHCCYVHLSGYDGAQHLSQHCIHPLVGICLGHTQHHLLLDTFLSQNSIQEFSIKYYILATWNIDKPNSQGTLETNSNFTFF